MAVYLLAQKGLVLLSDRLQRITKVCKGTEAGHAISICVAVWLGSMHFVSDDLRIYRRSRSGCKVAACTRWKDTEARLRKLGA